MTPDQVEDAALFELRPEWQRLRRGRTATRTERHRFLLGVGLHPLSLVLRRALKLYPAVLLARRGMRLPDSGATCGTCVHLGKLDWAPDGEPNLSDFKCWKNTPERVTRGRATTIRKWWPACVDYEEA